MSSEKQIGPQACLEIPPIVLSEVGLRADLLVAVYGDQCSRPLAEHEFLQSSHIVSTADEQRRPLV